MTDTASKSCPSCFKDIDARALRCPFCAQRQSDVVGFYRDVPGRALGGVCAAIAQHFNWDVTLMRILFIASLAFTGGLVFWVYFAAWAMTPFAQHGKAPLVKLTDALGNLFSPGRGSVERV
jgi:phage shock protein PspC (stress-responsive transcriptional regulator)